MADGRVLYYGPLKQAFIVYRQLVISRNVSRTDPVKGMEILARALEKVRDADDPRSVVAPALTAPVENSPAETQGETG